MNSRIILLGDSAPEAVEPLRLSLQRVGYDLHPAQNVPDALAKARLTQTAAFLVDISAPELNGIQACTLLKAGEKAVPVIALNHHEVILQRAALAAGADVVMDLPLDSTAIRSWLAGQNKDETFSPGANGLFLGSTREDIIGTSALLGHDLKAPIGIIISTLEVLISMHENNEAMASTIRLLRGALSASIRQMNLISDMIDLTRLETETYELELEDVDLVELICQGLDGEAYALTTKRLELEIDLPEEPLSIRLDELLFLRVISALVDNVIKFTTREDKLIVKAWREGDQIIMTFTDNGRLIFPEFERNILERAPHWDGRQIGTRTSVGMGLPFIRAFAQAHGGTFTAKSDQDAKETIFTLTLPAHMLDNRQGENSHG